MSVRRFLWLVLAALHIAVVIAGACHDLPGQKAGPTGRAIRWYATMSAAGANYQFFAPNVGARHRARVLLQDAGGASWSDAFDRTNSPEAHLRLSGIVDSSFMSGDVYEWPQWRQRLVSSWAAEMFTRHPHAVSQTIIVEAYVVPTMAEYRAGSRPTWRETYRAEFQRHPDASPNRSES